MKTMIAAVISLAPLMAVLLAFQHTSLDVFAISDYQSGYMHGVHDGSPNCEKSDKCVPYVLQPGKGFITQTKEFRDGYVTGYCSVPGNENSRSDAGVAGWDCNKGPSSANWHIPDTCPTILPLASDNYTQAIQRYDKALAINPNEKHALNGKGDALYNQGYSTQAIQYYDRVLDIDPRDKNALDGKGNALNDQGNYTQAIQSFDKALTIDPKDSSALNGKGDAFYCLANDTRGYKNAIQSYGKALAIYPNDTYALHSKGSALTSLGSAFGLSGNYTQAFQYYDKALAIDPNDTYTLDSKGNAFSSLGNYTQAFQYYDKALAVNPDDTNALNGKGNALSGQGNNTQLYSITIMHYQ